MMATTRRRRVAGRTPVSMRSSRRRPGAVSPRCSPSAAARFVHSVPLPERHRVEALDDIECLIEADVVRGTPQGTGEVVFKGISLLSGRLPHEAPIKYFCKQSRQCAMRIPFGDSPART